MIPGVGLVPLIQNVDSRGWLCEFWRSDWPREHTPEMGYVSMTLPGVTRGPHEHLSQTDYFVFFGHFELILKKGDLEVNREITTPTVAVIPPGVVHSYKCLGPEPGMVINLPDRLYCGYGRSGPPDEIRHEIT